MIGWGSHMHACTWVHVIGWGMRMRLPLLGTHAYVSNCVGFGWGSYACVYKRCVWLVEAHSYSYVFAYDCAHIHAYGLGHTHALSCLPTLCWFGCVGSCCGWGHMCVHTCMHSWVSWVGLEAQVHVMSSTAHTKARRLLPLPVVLSHKYIDKVPYGQF